MRKEAVVAYFMIIAWPSHEALRTRKGLILPTNIRTGDFPNMKQECQLFIENCRRVLSRMEWCSSWQNVDYILVLWQCRITVQ